MHALGKPRLAWETTVSGRDGKQPSVKKVYVDARTGKRFDEKETIYVGTGTGIWEGSNLTIGTTQSGGQYTMRDPEHPGLTCADYSGRQIFSGRTTPGAARPRPAGKPAAWTSCTPPPVNGTC